MGNNSFGGRQNQIATVLICGNTNLLSGEMIRFISSYYRVVLVGADPVSGWKLKNVHCYPIESVDEGFSRLFDAYTIDAIWYFSGYEDDGTGLYNENKYLDAVLTECRRESVRKLIVLSSLESLNYRVDPEHLSRKQPLTEKALYSAQFEDAVWYLTKDMDQKTIIIRVPYLAEKGNSKLWLSHTFDRLKGKKEIVLGGDGDTELQVLSMVDLIELLIYVSEESLDTSGKYSIFGSQEYTNTDMADAFRKLDPGALIRYDGNQNRIKEHNYENQLKKIYGFVQHDDVIANLEEYYLVYLGAEEYTGPLQKLVKKVKAILQTNLVRYLELIAFFLVTEALLKVTADSVYFRFVDVRLLYVLLMGSVHGMQTGILAGILECISLTVAFRALGTTGSMLFYNIDNWLPFVIYLMVGSITGYMRSVSMQKQRFLKEENRLITEKYLFLNSVYQGVIENKSDYKKQILGYQDSFGKIFEAVQKLDHSIPENIFLNGVKTLEQILDNHSIAIYTIDKSQRFGRLAACSEEWVESIPGSIEMDHYHEICQVIKKGETWKNKGLDENLPMYAYGVGENGELSVVIFLFKANLSQQSLYYMNLFTILGGLVKMSFMRAMEYQNLINDEKYYEETIVLREDFFENQLSIRQEMSILGIANYMLIRFESDNCMEVQQALRGKIRQTDILGKDKEGHICLLLTQANEKGYPLIREKLEQTGLHFERIK